MRQKQGTLPLTCREGIKWNADYLPEKAHVSETVVVLITLK